MLKHGLRPLYTSGCQLRFEYTFNNICKYSHEQLAYKLWLRKYLTTFQVISSIIKMNPHKSINTIIYQRKFPWLHINKIVSTRQFTEFSYFSKYYILAEWNPPITWIIGAENSVPDNWSIFWKQTDAYSFYALTQCFNSTCARSSKSLWKHWNLALSMMNKNL